jgi:hypothetical protein
MTGGASDHWSTGDPDLGRRARDLWATRVDADVVLVQLHRDRADTADPEQDGRVLAALWRAATGSATDGPSGRRLSWRSFVLLVDGESKAVREAISRAADRIRGTHDAGAWRVSVQWVQSSGDFVHDVKRLEAEAGLDLA